MSEKAEELYADIINLPHHELTTRQRMPRINRAASFSPFAALTGKGSRTADGRAYRA